MGMIMNRFDMFTQMRRDIRQTNTYNHFVLCGVVVHDINDSELINAMSNKFVQWAEMTGNHFLFITFIQPSVEWKNSKFCHDSYWIDKDNLMTDPTFSKEDEERTIPLLRDFMNLPLNGSYLMLTDNICSNSFYKIPICANTIEDKFLLITKYCEDEHNGVEHSPSDYQNLLFTLKAREHFNVDTLLDILIDYTALTSKINKNIDNETQYKYAKSVIIKLREKLREYEGEDFEERLFNLFECVEIVNTQLFKSNPRLTRQPIEHYMDDYSKKLFKTYNLLTEITCKYTEDLDYSGLTIYLGKIVENELHLSVGQMLRWAMGIDMPTYFNKYCHGKIVKVRSGNQDINLNKRDESRQRSIPMGTLLNVYETMYNQPDEVYPTPDFNRLTKLNSDLLSFLKDFCRFYRNRAGHLDPNSKETYEGAKEAFKQFGIRYIQQLYKIKEQIRQPL